MTSALRQSFEYELYKLLSPSNNIKSILNEEFLKYDTNKTGYVNKDGWYLTFKNLGLTNFNDNDFDALFYIYDINDSGLINYLNFIEYFSNLQYNFPKTQNNQNNYTINSNNNINQNPNYNTSYNINQEKLNITNQNSESFNLNNINYSNYSNSNISNINQTKNPIINQKDYAQYDYSYKDNNSYYQEYSNENHLMHPNQYRIKVWEKGESEGMRRYLQSLVQLLQNEINSNSMIYSYLSTLLKSKQDPLTGTITFEDFVNCLNEAKINYSKINIKDFYQYLDIYNQNKVSIVEILNLLRGYLNDIRMKIIIEIFVYIDSERKNYIEVDKLKKLFNPNNHHYVILGIKNPNDIYKEFIFCLNNFIIYKGINNKISFDDFIEFFTGISATIKNDLVFNNMMNNIFNPINIFEKRNEIKNNLSNKDIKEINKKDKYLLSYENPIIKLKNNILSLGIKGLFEFEKQFYNNDIRKTGKIDYNIFENICYNYSLNKEDIKKLENIFDKYQTKTINYNLIIKSLIDNMPENRVNLIKKVFILLRPDVNGYIKIKDILNYYNYDKDPDIISGKKNKDIVKNELKYYLDIIKQYEFIKNKATMDLMNFGEFINFYNQISIYIPNDKEFENLIKNVWGI